MKFTGQEIVEAITRVMNSVHIVHRRSGLNCTSIRWEVHRMETLVFETGESVFSK